jgi:hypothetical protein
MSLNSCNLCYKFFGLRIDVYKLDFTLFFGGGFSQRKGSIVIVFLENFGSGEIANLVFVDIEKEKI